MNSRADCHPSPLLERFFALRELWRFVSGLGYISSVNKLHGKLMGKQRFRIGASGMRAYTSNKALLLGLWVRIQEPSQLYFVGPIFT